MTDQIPSTVRGTEADERYGDVLAARARAQASQPLGDESALDILAMRDHVVGLEAELANARAEAAHAQAVAAAVRAELASTMTVRLLRGLRMARRFQTRVAARRASARSPR